MVRDLALGHLKPGSMNKTEAAYAQRLELLRRAGKILWYEFGALSLRLAPDTFYRPDFAVMAGDSVLEMHEVKGFWREDARVKIKVAAELFPFRFLAVQRAGSDWTTEVF